ncbi:MAG: hypothetical protein A2W95_03285 [Bacteroidetes bacterium GWA2_40_14]|nr:MAG: hypothetical protein A2W95_03285 [Bacteroidetes bacterium GWA2_40_14]
MMRNKYILDTDKLVFQKDQRAFSHYFKAFLKYVGFGMVIGVLFWLITFSGLLVSPKKMALMQENKHLVSKLESINTQFDSVSGFLVDVQNRDDNFYRVISQIEPIPHSIRQAGFGGTDKYRALEGFGNSDLLIETSKKSDILLNQLHIQSKSYDTIINCAKNLDDSLLSIPAIAPVSPSGYITISSPFGRRFHPIQHIYLMHDGVDFAANVGSPIYSSGNGLVAFVEKNSSGYGNYVIINHGFGFQTLYAHMNKIYVKKGESIIRGQQIGTTGNSGSSTGPHLHYEVIYSRIKRNPENFFINDLSDTEYLDMIRAQSSK